MNLPNYDLFQASPSPSRDRRKLQPSPPISHPSAVIIFFSQNKTERNIPMKPNLLKTVVRTTLLFQFATFNLQVATAATIIGNLKDISQQSLDTRISFAPTNQVLVTGGGLSV